MPEIHAGDDPADLFAKAGVVPVHVFFQPVPDSPDKIFVEIENERGQSIRVGTWSKRDGYDVLTILAVPTR